MKRTWVWILAIAGAFVVVFLIGLAFFMRAWNGPFGMMRGYGIERGYGMMRGGWGCGMMGFGGHGFGLLALPVVLLLVALGVIVVLRRPASRPAAGVVVSPSTPTPTATVAQGPVNTVVVSPTITCPNCGKPVQDYWVACPNCGEKLPHDEEVKPS